jgi:hypothetical protein
MYGIYGKSSHSIVGVWLGTGMVGGEAKGWVGETCGCWLVCGTPAYDAEFSQSMVSVPVPLARDTPWDRHPHYFP